MTWKIVADSSCDLQEGLLCVPEVSFSIVPLKIRVGEREFVDDLLRLPQPRGMGGGI